MTDQIINLFYFSFLFQIVSIITIVFILKRYHDKSIPSHQWQYVFKPLLDDKYEIIRSIEKVEHHIKKLEGKQISNLGTKLDDISSEDLNLINSDLLVVMNMVRYLQEDLDLIIDNNPELKKIRDNKESTSENDSFGRMKQYYPKRYKHLLTDSPDFYRYRNQYRMDLEK